jgi:glycosyltransferase involved in cell wall biosynthesis
MVKSLLAFSRGIAIAGIVESGGYEHIHAHWSTYPATAAMTASLLTRIPFSFAFHAYDLFDTRILLRRKLDAAAFAVLNSQCSVTYLQQIHPTVDNRKLVLLYNGLDLDPMASRRDGSRKRTSPPLILGIGRLVRTKGFRYLLEACHLLADEGRSFRLILIGAGPEEARLRSLVRRYQLENVVQFAGQLTEDKVSEQLSQAEVLVAPSLDPGSGSHDVLPNVILEAQASGIPVVATNVFAIPETVIDGTSGLLVPQEDAPALKQAIAHLLDDFDHAARLAETAKKNLRQNFDIHRNGARLLGLFQSARDARQNKTGQEE